MRKAVLEYRLEQAEKTIGELRDTVSRICNAIDQQSIVISALKENAGIVSIRKEENDA